MAKKRDNADKKPEETKPKAEASAETKPKTEVKPDPKAEPKPESKIDPKAEPKTESRPHERPKDHIAADANAGTADKKADTAAPEDASHNNEHDKFAEMAKKAAAGAGKATGAGYDWARIWVQNPDANIKRIDRLLNWVRETIPADLFDRIASWFSARGQSAMVIAQLLTAVFFFLAIFATKDFVVQILYGAAFFFTLILTQYAAAKFLSAGEKLIQSSPSKLRSTAFLDCTAIMVEIAGILIFVSMLKDGIKAGDASTIAFGAGIWLICDMFVIVALHPSLINVTIAEDVRAGEEAIGILSFFVKALVRIVPIFFGLGAIFGAVGILISFWSLFAHHSTELGRVFMKFAMVSACLPFIGYVIFILYHLTIDIVRSLLVLPHKLDELKK